MAKHKATTGKGNAPVRDPRGRAPVWYARCTCGWVAGAYLDRASAVDAGNVHKQAHGE